MKVIYANSNNMNKLNSLLNKDNVVVFFTAPWCGHCQQLKPVMENVFGRFKSSRLPGTICNIQDKEIPRMAIDSKIDGFPTIRHYNNGVKVKDFSGMRDERSISNFLAKVFEENLNKSTVSIGKIRRITKKRFKKRRRKKSTKKKNKRKKRKPSKNRRKKKKKSRQK
jgi:thioredoxin-like negative regulator of GroEL